MNKEKQILKSLQGGSLNSVFEDNGKIKKTYAGHITRGHEKLDEEFVWLQLVDSQIKRNYPTLFPVCELEYNTSSNVPTTSLLFNKIEKIAMSKLILAGDMKANQAVDWFKLSLATLLSQVYTMRMSLQDESVSDVFEKYHAARLRLSVNDLSKVQGLSSIFTSNNLRVNNSHVFSINTILEWVNSVQIKEFLFENFFYSIHGNLHPDNILVGYTSIKKPQISHITFIDPRGDLLGPTYYDFGKLLTVFHAYYDEIHYDYFDLSCDGTNFQIEINSPVNTVYTDLLASIIDTIELWMPYTSKNSPNDFLRVSAICQLIHIISFCFYHYNRPNVNIKRVQAYLITACYLGTLLIKHHDDDAKIRELYVSRLLM